MNKFEIKKAEAMRVAKLLMMQLHMHRPYFEPHHGDSREQKLCPRMFQAVENLLRSHILEKPFKFKDAFILQEALNFGISLAGIVPDAILLPDNDDDESAALATIEPGSRVKIGGRTIRFFEQDDGLDSLPALAQTLLRYLKLFRESPELDGCQADRCLLLDGMQFSLS